MIPVPEAPRETERFRDLTRWIQVNPGFVPEYHDDKKKPTLNDLSRLKPVYLFRPDTRQRVSVLVKVFTPNSGGTQKFYRDMQNWVVWLGDQILRLEHESIAPFIGVVYNFGPIPAMVATHYPNGSILTYMKRNATSDSLKLEWTKQIAAGMKYLHTRKPPVIHGNLHGSNVLVDENTRCRITDIGTMGGMMLDRAFTDALTPKRMCWTAPELVSNYLPYASPGSDLPYAHPTTQSDVYAFAITLIEIYNGTPQEKPFGEVHDLALMTRIMRGERPDLPAVVLRSRELLEVVTRCWATDPDRRLTMRDVCVKLAVTTRIGEFLGR